MNLSDIVNMFMEKIQVIHLSRVTIDKFNYICKHEHNNVRRLSSIKP